MKGPTEFKLYINWMRSHYGKSNGVIKGWFLDNPCMENKYENSKKNYRRSKQKGVLCNDY